ncbi:cytochrome b [Caballeronia glebae]
MKIRSTLTYSAPARVFHWLTALLLLVQFALAVVMPDVTRDTKPDGLIAWHLGVGMSIVLLVIIRLFWRSTHSVPPELPTLPKPLRVLAALTHWCLYALLLVVPIMGWANASSRAWDVMLLGAVPMPALSPAGSPIGHALGDWHGNLAWVLLALIGMHVAAALYHHFVLRDQTLRRML